MANQQLSTLSRVTLLLQDNDVACPPADRLRQEWHKAPHTTTGPYRS
jgi:hypothetical protein